MKNDEGEQTDSAAALRKRAELIARRDSKRAPEDILALPHEESCRILHELRVYQIELELQNEELRQAQAELDASRARYFDLYDLAPVGYCTLCENGLIQETNLTAAALLKIDRSSLVHQPIFRFIFLDDQDIFYQFRRRLLKTGEPQIGELRMIRVDGSPIWVRVNATVTPGEDGALLTRLVMSDLTEHKRIEEEQERLKAQLHQSQKMESIGRLAGGVAHDFNNMLSVIIGNTEMVMTNLSPDEPLHGFLQEILTAAKRSAQVTAQLLAYARKQAISPEVLCLNDAMEDSITMLRRLIGEDIDVVWHPDGRLWSVAIDPVQIDQILANLCVNARDAIDGVGKISIETENVTIDAKFSPNLTERSSDEFVLLTVSDNGCGMNHETMSNLFEPYFTTKTAEKGTGLGLAMIYGIVKQNKGFISVDSKPGQGTTFKIYLPRHISATASIHDAPDPATTEVTGGATILLVEDEPAILRMAGMMLERLRYNVLAASTPDEALRLASSHPDRIDLLLTDVIMPGMNGRDLARKLLTHHPYMRLVFMSGYSASVIADGEIMDARVHFIQKPFSMMDLAINILRALEQESLVLD
jgi:PAS domain S-box-containing protein